MVKINPRGQNHLTALLVRLLSIQGKGLEDVNSRLLQADCSSSCNNIGLKQLLNKLEELIPVQSSRRSRIISDNKKMQCKVTSEAEPASIPPISLDIP